MGQRNSRRADSFISKNEGMNEDARRSYEEARAIVFAELSKHPTFWVNLFEGYSNERHRAIDKRKHDALAVEGEECIRKNNLDGLRATCGQMKDNLVKGPGQSHPEVLAGLMR